MAKIIIGCDPGKAGAYAILDQDGQVIDVQKAFEAPLDIYHYFCNAKKMAEEAGNIIVAYLELVRARPGDSASSMFTFGQGFGHLQMALLASGIRTIEVPPAKWMRAVGVPSKAKDETHTQYKNRLKAKAQQLFPDQKVTLANADALLIAEYGRKNE